MAQRKISSLEKIVASEIKEDSVFPLVQDGATRIIEYKDLKKPMVNEVTSDVSSYVDTKFDESKSYADEKVQDVWSNGINAFHSVSVNQSSPESYVNIGNGGNICRFLANQSKVKLTGWGVGQETVNALYIDDETFEVGNIMILDATLILKDNRVLKLSPKTPSEISNSTNRWLFQDLTKVVNSSFSVDNEVKYLYIEYLILH